MSNEMQSNYQPLTAPKSAQPAVELDWELEDRISQFELVWSERGEVAFADFLPASDHPRFDVVAMELMRVDAELATRAGFHRDLKFYVDRLPRVLKNEESRRQLAFELSRLSAAVPSQLQYPQVGETVAGFELLSELGVGAFSRVYLAAENALSRRLMILKFSTKFPGEASTLARLQHKNIVPIYSWHRHNQFHVVCMPYLGATTLWDFLKSYSPFGKRRGSASAASELGQAIVSTVHNRRSQTLADVRKRQSADSNAMTSNASTSNASTQQALSENSVQALVQTVSCNGDATFAQSDETRCEADSSVTQLPIEESDKAVGLSRETPRLLERQRNAETIVWIGKELAAGLMHAHDRGILHRDIKPANILLADDSTPMLLDFNLAAFEAPQQFDQEVGGTPRYMSPEQLQSINEPNVRVDAKSDLYSLGVVLYELAVGRSPFSENAENWQSAVPKMIEQRRTWSASQTVWPRDLSSSAIEIITKLLAFDPQLRYRSARDLHEDLERQLTHLPLKHARNRSLSERVRKWTLRHPRLSSGAVVSCVLGAVIIAMLSVLVWHQIELQQLNSLKWLSELEQAQLPAQALLASSSLPVGQVHGMLSASDKLVGDPNAVIARLANLSSDDQSKASQLAGQLLLFRARGNYRLAEHERNAAQRAARLNAALTNSRAAEKYLQHGKAANGQLLRVIQKAIDGKTESAELQPAIPQEILDQTQQLLGVDAGNPWYWWVLGHKQFVTGDNEGAAASAQVASQLDPTFPWSHYLFALIAMQQSKFAQAEVQLTKVIETFEIDDPEVYMNRAVTRLAQKNPLGAQQDLHRIKSEADRLPRIHFLYEQAYRMLGDHKSAREALERGLAAEPTEGHGYMARGDARLRSNPPDASGAQSDFQRASQMLPMLTSAYENQAYILSELLDEREAAIEVLTRGIEKLPQRASLYASRATLHGRSKNLEAARQDVEAALQLDRSAMVCYQAASALLLASKSTSDLARAIDLLKETLRKDPNLKAIMESDRDLGPLRDSEQFKAVMNAATQLQ